MMKVVTTIVTTSAIPETKMARKRERNEADGEVMIEKREEDSVNGGDSC